MIKIEIINAAIPPMEPPIIEPRSITDKRIEMSHLSS